MKIIVARIYGFRKEDPMYSIQILRHFKAKSHSTENANTVRVKAYSFAKRAHRGNEKSERAVSWA